jgi:hypothetical protein
MLLPAAAASFAQSPPVTFEVASVKLAQPISPGPDWMNAERFDVLAKLPQDAFPWRNTTR